MRNLILSLIILFPLLLQAQTNNSGTFKVRKINSTVVEEAVYTVVESMPQFSGGDNALFQFLSDNTVYPPEAKANGISGTVFVSFIIGKDGTVYNTIIVRGVDELLDNEALRIIKLMPKWIPGRNKGQPVDVIYNLPIKFVLK